MSASSAKTSRNQSKASGTSDHFSTNMTESTTKHHIRKLIQQCEEQCLTVATSTTDHSLVELRNTIWLWPPPSSTLAQSPLHDRSDGKKIGDDNMIPGHSEQIWWKNSDDKKMSTASVGVDDSDDAVKKCPSSSLFLEPLASSQKVHYSGLETFANNNEESSNDDNWWRIQNSKSDESEMLFQLVITDLDISFINACRDYFHHENKGSRLVYNDKAIFCRESGNERGEGHCEGNDVTAKVGKGVRILHQPLQQAIADSLRQDNEDDIHTFIVFGSYGTFPCLPEPDDDDNKNPTKQDRGGLMTGFCKTCIAPLFPSSWENFASQCHHHYHKQQDPPSRVWISLIDEIPNVLTLVACEAYPRNQYPSEEEAAARRWQTALEMIADRVGLHPLYSFLESPPPFSGDNGLSSFAPSTSRSRYGTTTKVKNASIDGSECNNPARKMPKKKRVRIITHAMGSFVGHLDTGVFAQGLAIAVDEFCSKFNVH